MDYIKKVRKKIKSIETEIVEFESDYPNKYHVFYLFYFAALVGEYMKNTEINKFIKFKKKYYEKYENLDLFNLLKKIILII